MIDSSNIKVVILLFFYSNNLFDNMTAWSPSGIISNLATSLTCSLRRMHREDSRDQLIRSALLADDFDENESHITNESNSRPGSPEIPMLDSPSVFRVASATNDENCDPNTSAYKTRSRTNHSNAKMTKRKDSIDFRGT